MLLERQPPRGAVRSSKVYQSCGVALFGLPWQGGGRGAGGRTRCACAHPPTPRPLPCTPPQRGARPPVAPLGRGYAGQRVRRACHGHKAWTIHDELPTPSTHAARQPLPTYPHPLPQGFKNTPSGCVYLIWLAFLPVIWYNSPMKKTPAPAATGRGDGHQSCIV